MFVQAYPNKHTLNLLNFPFTATHLLISQEFKIKRQMLLHVVLVSHTEKVVIFGTGIHQQSKQVILNFYRIIEKKKKGLRYYFCSSK